MPSRWAAALICILLGAPHAAAQEMWPTRPIHVIVPFAAGSIVDIVPRIIFDQVSEQIRQPIVVENRPGAGSTIGAAIAAKSSPDGYSLLVNSSAQTIAPAIYSDLPYDAARDFAAVAPLGMTPLVLVTSPLKGIKTLRALADMARSNNGGLTFASLGVGTATHMAAERFRFSAQFAATNVSFKGAPAAVLDVIEGRVDYCFCAIGSTLAHIRDGKLLALAVSSPRRAAALPNTPTTLEEGFANSDYIFWFGLFAPARTPRATIGRLNTEVSRAVRAPAVSAKLTRLGIEQMTMSASDFDAFVKRESARNAALVDRLGLKHN